MPPALPQRPAAVLLWLAAVFCVAPNAWSGCASGGTDLAGARALMKAGKLARACALLERLVGQPAPPASQLDTLRAAVDCLDRIGEPGRAARLVAGRSPRPLRLYGEALLEIARSPAGLPRAVALLAEAGRLWPEVGEIPYRAGLLLLADEQPAAALPLLERACHLTDSAACAAARAHALLDLDRTDQALKVIAELPRLQPRPEDVARGRGLIQRIARRSAGVPASAAPRLARARELAEGRPAEALRLGEELLVDFPRLAAVHTLLGLTHLRLANVAEAVVALRRAAELNPLDAVNPLFLGVIYQSRGRSEEAIESYQQALRLDPFLAGAAQRLGELLLRRGAARQAAEVLEQACAVDGGTPLSLRLAGRAHLAARALERAEQRFSRLLEREPEDFEVNLRLAQILLARHPQGGSAELRRRAARHLDRAARANPGDPEVEQLRRDLRAGTEGSANWK